MAEQPVQKPSERDKSHQDSAYDRFESLAKRLLHVSKDDVREAEIRERDKRRTA